MKNPNPLIPLSSEKNTEFLARREAAGVVQSKCPKCGAWYETMKLEKAFTETFICDCGQRLELIIPAAESLKDFIMHKPTEADMILFADPNQKLDTGMTAREAIQLAQIWWDKTGAKEMRLHGLRQSEHVGGSNKGAGASFATLNPADKNYLPSNIVAGRPWDVLTKTEKLNVIKHWHHYYIRMPDNLTDPDRIIN